MRLLPVMMLTTLMLLAPAAPAQTPQAVPLVAQVDLPRFMGDWYVIAHIPPSVDKGAHNAVESYALDGEHIATTYRRRDGSFSAPETLSKPTGYVVEDTGNALWGMRFFWWLPIRFEFRIAHLEPDYSVTIIARSRRDYVWLMSRQPTMSEQDYARYVAMIASWGYDTRELIRVPQQWSSADQP
ncbi:apolipoprotein D and lipocalin family protein [Solimonas aquatica]|uniref:Outer membrane lipoprotein Blc n=1 Tax=Solimonas aquatica TaxID=489703 RepID=A0A1H9DK76_9GAMM|nr:lipocalin family protein [Solimonas aquatica]SEQ13910.1 apolipoprotein D and lipocalin family protein [Solimonas aquatica]